MGFGLLRHAFGIVQKRPSPAALFINGTIFRQGPDTLDCKRRHG